MDYDLRSFVDDIDRIGELERITDAHWDCEIGAITEIVAERGGGLGGSALLFDDVEDYPSGSRILTNGFGSIERSRLALGMPDELSPIGMIDRWRREYRSYEPLEPTVVDADSAPLVENVVRGSNVDVTAFPVPRWHDHDGGRYIGTGCYAIMQDPETGWVNLGIYRSMIVDETTVSLWIAPGKDGRVIMDSYHERGEPCPVALVVGSDPHTWIASMCGAKREEGEYGIAGWLRGEPIPVVEGETTGLPIPADAEIVLEGTIPPLSERSCVDGPFGEWLGYATPAHEDTPVIDVDTAYHRDDPILLGQPPLKPPALYTLGVPIRTAGGVWNQLEEAGVPGVTGVWSHVFERPTFLVVAIDQEYAGHAKQAAAAAVSSPSGMHGGRFVVVVDRDVDITDLEDVIWAMCTRCRAEEIDIVHDLYTTPLDPTLEDRSDNRSSRVLIDATRPYGEEFPPVNQLDEGEYRDHVIEEWNLRERGWIPQSDLRTSSS